MGQVRTVVYMIFSLPAGPSIVVPGFRRWRGLRVRLSTAEAIPCADWFTRATKWIQPQKKLEAQNYSGGAQANNWQLFARDNYDYRLQCLFQFSFIFVLGAIR